MELRLDRRAIGFHEMEDLTAQVGDVDPTIFDCSPYRALSLRVYINGLLQLLGTDYAETSPTAGTFTMAVAPVAPDTVQVDIIKL